MLKFKDIMLDNQHLDMQQQKAKIVEAFEDWKGITPQIDDVLVMGCDYERPFVSTPLNER